MAFKFCHLLPIIQGILYCTTFLTTYILSTVVNEDVPAVFPYVSDTGVWSVERCIFSFMLGLGSLLMQIIIYIRYRQVKKILETNKEADWKPTLKTINLVSLYLSVISTLNIFILSCFPVNPYLMFHLTAAFMAFTFGLVTLIIQTYISFKIYPVFGSKYLNIFRAIVVVILVLAWCLTGCFGLLSFIFFRGDDITQWTKSSGGYEFHLISVFSEWTLVMGFVFYLALYSGEFKPVVFYNPSIDIIKA